MFADYVVPSPTSDLSKRPEILRFDNSGNGGNFPANGDYGERKGAVTPPLQDQFVPSTTSGKLNFDFEEDAESSSGHISNDNVFGESDEDGEDLEDNIFFPPESDNIYEKTSGYDSGLNISGSTTDTTGGSAVSELELNYAMQGRVLLSIALSL